MGLCPRSFKRIANRDAQLFEVDGLADEIVCATTQGRDGITDLNVTRDHDHDRFGMFALDVAQHVEAGAIGRSMSSKTAAGGSALKFFIASATVPASTAAKPQLWSAPLSVQRIA